MVSCKTVSWKRRKGGHPIRPQDQLNMVILTLLTFSHVLSAYKKRSREARFSPFSHKEKGMCGIKDKGNVAAGPRASHAHAKQGEQVLVPHCFTSHKDLLEPVLSPAAELALHCRHFIVALITGRQFREIQRFVNHFIPELCSERVIFSGPIHLPNMLQTRAPNHENDKVSQKCPFPQAK